MELHDHKLLIIASFVVMISFLASIAVHHPQTSMGNQITGFQTAQPNSFNLSIQNQCASVNDIVFRLSAQTNAHAELWNQTNYNYQACATGLNNIRSCQQFDQNGTIYPNIVLRINGQTNAHVESSDQATAGYAPLCFGNMACIYVNAPTCNNIDPATIVDATGYIPSNDYQCLASVSGLTNAHVASCGQYTTQLCCTEIQGASPIICPTTCPGSFTCLPGTGQCLTSCSNIPSNVTVANFTGCAQGSVCTPTGTCNSACTTNSQCTGYTCNTQGGYCNAACTTNAQCQLGFSCYNNQCIATSGLDTDQDGVLDDGNGDGTVGSVFCFNSIQSCDDNCVATPNGPISGTCVAGNIGDPCTSNTQCGNGGACSLTQEDTDGDTYGDVCDDAPDDSCTAGNGDGTLQPGELNDLCPGQLNCAQAITSVRWDTTTAQEGSSVGLSVQADNRCNGLTFLFSVHDTGNPNVLTVSPQPATFASGSAQASWTAEYNTGEDNEFDFTAFAITNTASITLPSENTLTVNSNNNATCGNGIPEGSNGEECDDGNNNNNDACSNNCTLQGSQSTTPGACSDDCGFNQQGVCSASGPTTIRFCGNYDPDPCLELSVAQTCPSGQLCESTYGACVPQICAQTYSCSAYGACVSGVRERSCATSSTNPLCTSNTPQTQLACLEEPREAFPFFTWVNVLITLGILTLFYVVRGRRSINQ